MQSTRGNFAWGPGPTVLSIPGPLHRDPTLSNYLTSTLRNLLKHKGYSLINILGLSVGVGSCLLLLLVAKWETSYDTFHPDADRLYKVIRSTRMTDGVLEYAATTYGPLGPALEEDFPEVEVAIRLMPVWHHGTHEGKTLSFVISLTDPDFFDHFSFDIISGDPKLVAAEPFAIFVTEDLASRFFGDRDPLGKTLTIEEGHLQGDYAIRGVVKDLPANSHIHFDALLMNSIARLSSTNRRSRLNPIVRTSDNWSTTVAVRLHLSA